MNEGIFPKFRQFQAYHGEEEGSSTDEEEEESQRVSTSLLLKFALYHARQQHMDTVLYFLNIHSQSFTPLSPPTPVMPTFPLSLPVPNDAAV